MKDTVVSPICHWAAATPHKTALIATATSFTYAELEAQTTQLAMLLLADGITSGTRVALLLPRGVDAVLAMIAVLKAGATYVPLDPEMPQERLGFCLEDAQPVVILTEEKMEGLRSRASTVSTAAALPEIDLDTFAYVIFTSGTTGRPKGVPITHRSLLNFVHGNQEVCIRVAPEDRVFQGFSPASDGHHEEIWPTFLAGATLVVANCEEIHGGPELGEFLERHAVSIISCAPTLLSMVDGALPALRRILFGAERCPPELVRRWWTPEREVINTYGPTEATVGATFAPCRPGEPVTIGKPLPGYFCYVVDEQLQAVPVGEEGELCLAGVGLSPGYLGRPELTEQKFVPNPFASGRDDRQLYRTGDRVRYREDGNLEWLGRIDSQVKVRGYRIELSDIETHLVTDPAVRAAVVVLRGVETPTPVLTGLLVPRQDVTLDGDALLVRLRAELPGYMIPQLLEVVPSLPVLPSGKIDRRAAQVLHGAPLETTRVREETKTPTEGRIKEIWEALFPEQRIGRNDDFFLDLGGHSLLAAQFVSRLRHEEGFSHISVREVYAHTTLAAFAAFLDTLPQKGEEDTAPRFQPVEPQRYQRARVLQTLGIFFLFGFKAFFWLFPILSTAYCSTLGYAPLASVFLGLSVHAASVPLSLALVIALKWLVLGRMKEGEFPLWGTNFVRWWFVQRIFELSPREFLTGTPLASVYLRLLGAKIGRNVYFDTLDVDCPDLLEIGDDTTVETMAWLRATRVEQGLLVAQPVRIGAGCVVGVRAGVEGGAALETGAVLGDLSVVREGVRIPKGEEWHGSPAKKADTTLYPPYEPKAIPKPTQRWLFALAQIGLVLLLPYVDMAPFTVATLMFYRLTSHWASYLAAPLYAVALIVVVAAQLLVIKWGLLGRVKPGTYPTHGWFSLRKWFVDKLMDLNRETITPLYDTLYTRYWCKALGMACGPRTEMDLPARLPYDLVELGTESFVASDVSLGLPRRRNQSLVLERTVTAERVFLGNNSVIPQGSVIPRDTLIGALSVAPQIPVLGAEVGQSWMGSPPFRLPHREATGTFAEKQTYRPTPALVFERFVHESIRMLLPSLAFLGVADLMINSFIGIWQRTQLGVAIAATPLLYLGIVVLSIAMVYGLKKLLIGTYRPTIQPLWSRYVWNSETFSLFFHDFGASIFLTSLLGTPYMAAFLRLMGATVGKRAYIDTGDLTEFDLLHIGEDAAVNFNAPLQAHLFEDRVMKVGPVTIGDRCTVGTFSVVLFDAVLEADTYVGPLSLVLKGETFPSGTAWEGSPAQNAQLMLRCSQSSTITPSGS